MSWNWAKGIKQLVLLTVALYFTFGFTFAVYAYSHDLRYFRCEDPSAPHGYVGLSTRTFENPDPDRCVRRGLEWDSITTIPFFTVFGIPILIARGVSGNN